MKNILLSAAAAAMITMPVAAFADPPNPAQPAPSNPTSTSGAPTEAPAKPQDADKPADTAMPAKGDDKKAASSGKSKKHHHHHHKHHHHGGGGRMPGHKTF